MKHVLVFDAQCATCVAVAESVLEEASGKIEVLSIHDEVAISLLNKARPSGWEHQPYLLKVEEQDVTASSGIRAGLKLFRLAGIRRAWNVWRVMHKENVLVPLAKNSFNINRRKLFGAGLTISFMQALNLASPKIATANQCDPCFSGCTQLGSSTGCTCYSQCGSCANGCGPPTPQTPHFYTDYVCQCSGTIYYCRHINCGQSLCRSNCAK